MKKNLLLIALCFVASMTFVACGNDDDGGSSTPATSKLPTPIYQDEATKIEITSIDTEIKSIELTETGTYIIEWRDDVKPHVKGVKYSEANSGFTFGNFTIEGDLFKLIGFGILQIVENGVNVDLNITSEDGESYNLTGHETASGNQSSDLTNNLCRSWKVEKTRLVVDYDGIKLAHERQDFDLYAFVTYLKGKGIKIKDDFAQGKKAVNVFFTFAGTYCITYEDGSVDYGTWSLSQSTFKYTWKGEEMGNSLEDGSATISFDNNKLLLTIKAKFTEDGTTYDTTVKQWLVQS